MKGVYRAVAAAAAPAVASAAAVAAAAAAVAPFGAAAVGDALPPGHASADGRPGGVAPCHWPPTDDGRHDGGPLLLPLPLLLPPLLPLHDDDGRHDGGPHDDDDDAPPPQHISLNVYALFK